MCVCVRVCMCAHACVHARVLSRIQLFGTLWTVKPTRPLCPCNFPGKNIGAGCHFFLQGDLPDPEIEPTSHHVSSTGREILLTAVPPG